MDTPSGQIDFTSHVPYYLQLMNLLRAKINAVWKPGDQIPGEQELCAEYGVSRTVVRQTLRELELEGLIYRRKGKGTFVSEPKINESLVQRLTGFYQDMVERGLKPRTRVLKNALTTASRKVARYLEIQEGSRVVELKRLRYVNDVPIQLVTSYLPYDLVPGLTEVDLTNRSLYEFLEHEMGLFITRGRRTIEAVSANDEEAKLLDVPRGAPMVMLDSVSYLADGRVVEYYHAVHRGDRSRFEVELVRAHGPVQPAVSADLPRSNVVPQG